MLTFTAQTNGAVISDYFSSFEFVLPDRIEAREIEPRNFFETSGDIRTSVTAALRNDAAVAAGDAFSRMEPTTYYFAAREKTDEGYPNFLLVTGSRLFASVDPVARIATFGSRENESERLRGVFPAAYSHEFAFTWDATGPRGLFIDGSPAKSP